MTLPYGARCVGGVTSFRVRSPEASALWLCLPGAGGEQRIAMQRSGNDWTCVLPMERPGAAYGYRADGEWAPARGLWFDPAKLLVDPYAVTLDRRFVQDPALAVFGLDTAHFVPWALVPGPDLPAPLPRPPLLDRGGLIYEINVRGFTMLHPDVPPALRGTIAALAEPVIMAHLKNLHVSAIELMPITAWIDERHLGPLGLHNAWGYNPVALMALDPGLCPGGVVELRQTVAALHAAGIGVILDLVFNHSGESDIHGGVLSLRGLDNAAYAHAPDGSLINDTGCGNTLDFANPAVRALTLASLRHFVSQCGVDGFRFDLAPIMARGPGFAADAPMFAEIAADPLLSDRIMIAEPWDIGPGGYQLGNFPADWLEWNDRFRDDVRRFWRGDGGIADLVTRIAGSSDVFNGECRSVNFLAAHDGFTLADTVAYARKHNHANGEDNRDGHGDEPSWNCGSEGNGPDLDPALAARRSADLRALLATLFASTGTIMLTAGDEFGRTQHGNNNAYAQDNPVSWIDWARRDRELESHVASLARQRLARSCLSSRFPDTGDWAGPDGKPMTSADWQNPATGAVTYTLRHGAGDLTLRIDRSRKTVAWDAGA
ncbi:glycogen debranching protein GlgX [Sandarakinorhabdus sp.]|uniref:glycogen debranching protein GlgX n=1 Tax=Sandarakinorhabdus sp. TaxID=1916663 RepID=UPI00286D97D3|nr:glycogen debranching protein GlgX [Sandarakinorhabdus sp.]